MKDLDDELRRWAHDQTDRAPQVHVDPDLFGGHRRRTWSAPLAAAAAVLVISGGVLAVRPWQTGSSQSAHPSKSSSERSVPPGGAQRASVFHDLAVDVPKSWPDNALGCGTSPRRDTVITTLGSVTACRSGIPTGTTWVQWETDAGYHAPIASGRTSQIRVGTLAATRTVGVRDGFHVVRVRIPKADAVVTISSPSARRAADIAATLHTVGVDANGCSVRSAVRSLEDARHSTLNRPVDLFTLLIPGRPSSMSICRYNNGRLEQSGAVPSASLGPAVRTIDDLPSGESEADPRDYLPSSCGPKSSDPMATNDEIYLVQVDYRDRPSLVLAAHLTYCGKLGITNGYLTGQFSSRLTTLLTAYAGDSVGGFPGRVVPVR